MCSFIYIIYEKQRHEVILQRIFQNKKNMPYHYHVPVWMGHGILVIL